jgi:tetratricopeptide (TPR) repeat protein
VAEQSPVPETVGDDPAEPNVEPPTDSDSELFASTSQSENQPESEIQQPPASEDRYSCVAMPEESAPQATEVTEPEVQQPPASEDRYSCVAMPEESAPQATEIVEEEVTPQVTEVAVVEKEKPAAEPAEAVQPFAILLPPQEVARPVNLPPASEPVQPTPPAAYPTTVFRKNIAALTQPVAVQMPEPKTPELDGLSDEERRLVEQVIRECSPAVTGVLTDLRVNEMATSGIREANALANRGAQYAAKQKLVEVLRMISQAKDAHAGDRLHTSALAAGLRALEEAEDFAPRGTQLEAELEIALITAAHRTPIARRLQTHKALPRQMMDLYFRYAQVKLANSVAGEPSGSMALYALGKVTSQMGQTEPDRNRLAHRRAVAFQQAALLAHNQNYFAAHELAVLLAESGHLAEAEILLKQVAARQPNPTIYRNLAQVQQRMGRSQQAANSRALATQLAGQNSGGSGQIRWVGPEAFGMAQAAPPRMVGPMPAPSQPPYDQRTAMTPPPRAAQQYGPNPPRSWR